MHLNYTDVNDAFTWMVENIHRNRLDVTKTNTRNGPVIQVDGPVTITYHKPLQRVLFNEARDANPFFHLYESLWMLAGRNDVAPLDYYSSKYSSFCSDDGVTTNGAYGHRWRKADSGKIKHGSYQSGDGYGSGMVLTRVPILVDQLTVLIEHLKKNPESRRAVLAMWNVEDDLMKIDTSKDVCCNTQVMFSLRATYCDGPHQTEKCPNCCRTLDMTVTNRSNDMILGMLGANVVHFSFLQEYMALALGASVGLYNQFTNNLHVYENNWKPKEWLVDYVNRTAHSPKMLSYEDLAGTHIPLYVDRNVFDAECAEFVERHSKDAMARNYYEPFLKNVAQPMCIAFHYHKSRNYKNAIEVVKSVAAPDWSVAGETWLRKRQQQWEERNVPKKTTETMDQVGRHTDQPPPGR